MVPAAASVAVIAADVVVAAGSAAAIAQAAAVAAGSVATVKAARPVAMLAALPRSGPGLPAMRQLAAHPQARVTQLTLMAHRVLPVPSVKQPARRSN